MLLRDSGPESSCRRHDVGAAPPEDCARAAQIPAQVNDRLDLGVVTVPALRHLFLVPAQHHAGQVAAVPLPTVPAADSIATVTADLCDVTAPDRRDDLRPDLLPLRPPSGEHAYTAVLARTAMGWHRPELSERGTVQAITDSVTVLMPQVTAAAVLVQSGSGQLHVTGSSGRLAAVVAALHRDRGNQPWQHTAEHLWSTRRGGAVRERDGWPVATMEAGGGERGWLVCAPLGRGKTMFGTLLIAIPTATGEQFERRLVAAAIHGSIAVAAARDRNQLRAAVERVRPAWWRNAGD